MIYLHFCDFAEEEHPLEGEKKKLEEILNIEILITGYRISDSRYKERKYITIQYKNGDEECIVFTGSEVLQKQIEKYKDKIPFYATIKKINKYYTLT
jgi:hypothetical protein